MSDPHFHRCPELVELGVEHGLGRSGSDTAAPADLVFVRQVHGVRVLEVPTEEAQPRADALITRSPGVAVGIRTADCVPILLVDARRRAVAAVHAGWRGSAHGISGEAVAGLSAGGSAPEELYAVVGPHIGPCCYEVDAPVRERIADRGVFSDSVRAGHYMLDLFELNRRQLLGAGVSAARIFRAGGCTLCDPEGYPSYRRDPGSGRLVHWVRLPA
jgi:YfiH family protein